MPFSVYLKSQEPAQEIAPHSTSRLTAQLLVAMGIVRPVGQRAVQIITSDTWYSVKCRLRGETHCHNTPRERYIPRHREDSPWGFHFPYNAPLPYETLRCYERSRVSA